MADRPILFSTPMVRALIEGRKTQTRRVLNPQPKMRPGVNPEFSQLAAFSYGADWQLHGSEPASEPFKVRFAVGDRLWVREAFCQVHPAAIQEGRYSQLGRAGIPGPPGVDYRAVYRADGEPLQVWSCEAWPYFQVDRPVDDIAVKHPTVCSNYARNGIGVYWTPGIHMPRWASRLTLAVTAVRVQRIRRISNTDAQAEGCAGVLGPNPDFPDEWDPSPTEEFCTLWNSLNEGRGFGWNANPWVVALTFKVTRANINAPEAKAA